MAATMPAAPPLVSIIIKALNEQDRIADCLRSALEEAAKVQGEVILVDSLSADRTVEIAQSFGVRVVQFEDAADIGCASAVQLGFQFSRAPFVYVLDADMVLQPDFLPAALRVLQADATLAGVAGKLLDKRVRTSSDARRALAAQRQQVDLDVDELGGGGLYRRSAVDATGYLAHRGLAAFEEAELGMRLRASGWRLRRLHTVAVVHEGHDETNLQMMRRLWRNGRAFAGGTLLRSAWGQAWWPAAVRKQAFVLAVPALHLAAALAAGGTLLATGRAWPGWCLLWAAVLAGLALRRASLLQAALSLVLWHYFAVAALVGAGRPVQSPHDRIRGRELLAVALDRPPSDPPLPC